MRCGICGQALTGGRWTAREMHYGTGAEFTYAQCAACECLQLVDVPADLGAYYGSCYYSTGASGPLRRAVRRAHLAHLSGRLTPLGALAHGVLGRRYRHPDPLHGVRPEQWLLDVGCGNGDYLYTLYVNGYRRLWGIDPFMASGARAVQPIRLERRTLLDVRPSEGPVDAVLFNHSLEHIGEQHESLERAAELLPDGGLCIVRVPTVSSWAWKHYGVDWVQLDAPRHLFLHSRRSLDLLARAHRFTVEETVDDSGPLQFWGSELYRSGQPMRAAGKRDRQERRVDPELMRQYAEHAQQLNVAGQGDQVTCMLRKEAGA